jgi:hypothetical protein
VRVPDIILAVNGFLSFLLLLIAASLLLLAAVMVRRRSSRGESAVQTQAMALMLGLAIGFLGYFLLGSLLFVFPLTVAAVLAWSWLRHGDMAQPGAFLLGFGALWTVLLGAQRWDDLVDPAITHPGWTAYPLATGVATLVLGLALLVAAGREGRA